MSEVWAVIVSIALFMIIYAYITAKIKERKRKKARAQSLPFVEDNVRLGVKYNVFLNDGRKFLNVELLGSSSVEEGQFSFAGWEGMLVLKQANHKRIFLKQSSVRYIEEI